MDTFSFLGSFLGFFSRRIYWIFLAVAEVCLILGSAFSQEINAYKTVASGDFPDVAVWVVWDGVAWNPAITKPSQANDIYIDQTHSLTLTGNEAVKSVFINADTLAGQKLNINSFNLDVYGSLNAFKALAPGIPSNAWNSQNWIGNSATSTLTFKGTSRVLIQKISWSGQTQRSRFSVIFEADAGETFTLEAPFKTLSFTIRSGIVFQKIDTSVIPNACFTLSFNTETTVFGVGPFGDLVIEPGAVFISQCNSNILNRSTSGITSALNFNLQADGTLILEGINPRIEAANFQMDGKVVFRGGTATKNYLTSSYGDAAIPNEVHDLEIQGTQNLNLPNHLTLSGNLEKSGTGIFNTNNTTLTLAGSGEQEILGFPLVVRDLDLNKTGGNFYPNSNLSVQRNLTLTQGSMDLEGNDLSINTELAGELNYLGGSWKNVGLFNYSAIPAILTASNSTFPFEDTRNGGIRKVQLLGNSAGGNLSVSFIEYEGAEYNSGFNDNDIANTPILYRLFSYFEFSNLTTTANPLELRISADKLIVDDVDDLRIVSTGYAAPGSHLAGLDPVELWARRDLTFADLVGKNFTIGSSRTLSILPIIWLEISSKFTSSGVWIRWSVAKEEETFLYEVYRNPDPLTQEWEKVGKVNPQVNPDQVQSYQFLDSSPTRSHQIYYRIRQVEATGKESWSEVTKVLIGKASLFENLIIHPNPYSSGLLQVSIPADFNSIGADLIIQDSQGKIVHRAEYWEEDLSSLFQNLAPGLYHLSIFTANRRLSGRILKK